MSEAPYSEKFPRFPRVLVVGLVGLIILLGFILVFRLTSQPNIAGKTARTDALANSTDRCVVCHRQASPGIVEQYGHSTMAGANVACTNCHEVTADYPGWT